MKWLRLFTSRSVEQRSEALVWVVHAIHQDSTQRQTAEKHARCSSGTFGANHRPRRSIHAATRYVSSLRLRFDMIAGQRPQHQRSQVARGLLFHRLPKELNKGALFWIGRRGHSVERALECGQPSAWPEQSHRAAHESDLDWSKSNSYDVLPKFCL